MVKIYLSTVYPLNVLSENIRGTKIYKEAADLLKNKNLTYSTYCFPRFVPSCDSR